MRFLLDPAPTDGGGTAPAPTTNPTGTGSTPPPAPAPVQAPPVTIALAASEVQRLYDSDRRFRDAESARLRDVEAKEQERLALAAQKAGIETEFTTYRDNQGRRYTTLETKYVERERSLAVANVLAGRKCVSDDATEQVKQILASRVEVVLAEDGTAIVRDKQTGRPAETALREWFDSPAAAHFLPATSKGGSGAQGGDRTNPTPPNVVEQPQTFEEAVYANWRARAESAPSGFAPVGRRGGVPRS